MGLIDRLRPRREEVAEAKTALDAARDAEAGSGGDAAPGALDRLVRVILDLGIDGRGPLDSAREVAREARAEARSDEDAVRRVARAHLVGGAVGGFVTGLGGFATMPVALPVNVLEFYVQATRMVAAIATLRGYDVDDRRVRTAVMLTLVGSDADEVLKRAGVDVGGGRISALAFKRVPPGMMIAINKGIGFRLVRTVGEKGLSRLGRGVPVVGGVVGGGLDGWMMKKIADHAMTEFPRREGSSAAR